MTHFSRLPSPVGVLLLTAQASALSGLYFADGGDAPVPTEGWIEDPSYGPLAATARQLEEYFRGKRREFDVPLEPRGTPFQRRVWAALRTIDFGRTTSYGALAALIGSPGGARAVGLANGRNPIAIIVPCHRVIGADGSLIGYGGGLDRKRCLLRHEGVEIE